MTQPRRIWMAVSFFCQEDVRYISLARESEFFMNSKSIWTNNREYVEQTKILTKSYSMTEEIISKKSVRWGLLDEERVRRSDVFCRL